MKSKVPYDNIHYWTILYYNNNGYSEYYINYPTKRPDRLVRRLQKIYDAHNSINPLVQLSYVLQYLPKIKERNSVIRKDEKLKNNNKEI